jgi:hypothetical protein
MNAYFMSAVIDAISGQHVEGGMGNVNDTGHAEDQRKPDSQKGVHTPINQTAYDYVQYHKASGACSHLE